MPVEARDGDIALATLEDKENSTSYEMLFGARDSACSVGYRRFRLRIVTSWRTPDQRHALKTVRRTVFLTGFRVPSHSFISTKKTPLTGAFFVELEMGLEPTTYWLRINCATNCATLAGIWLIGKRSATDVCGLQSSIIYDTDEFFKLFFSFLKTSLLWRHWMKTVFVLILFSDRHLWGVCTKDV